AFRPARPKSEDLLKLIDSDHQFGGIGQPVKPFPERVAREVQLRFDLLNQRFAVIEPDPVGLARFFAQLRKQASLHQRGLAGARRPEDDGKDIAADKPEKLVDFGIAPEEEMAVFLGVSLQTGPGILSVEAIGSAHFGPSRNCFTSRTRSCLSSTVRV